MDQSKHGKIKWEELTFDHTTQYFQGCFATYMGKYENNETKVKLADGNSSDLKKSARSRKKINDSLIFQGLIPNMCKLKTDVFLETFGQPEINQENSKQLEEKGE